MRTAFLCLSLLALLALLAPPAAAGDARLKSVEPLAAAGSHAKATVTLENDAPKAMAFKVSARLVTLGHKGRKWREKYVLAAGETRDVEISLPIPADVTASVVISGEVRWKGGSTDFDQGFISVPEDYLPPEGGGDTPPKPSDPPVPPSDLTTLSGTLSLFTVSDLPGGGDPFIAIFPDLRLVTDGDDTYWLIGGEASFLARLMKEAGLEETAAKVTGILVPMPGDRPFPGGPEFPFPGKNAPAPRDGIPLLVLTDWEADGVADPRANLVHHREVLSGPLSKIDAEKLTAVRDESAWESLLADAGIVLPDPPVFEPGVGDFPPGVGDFPPGIKDFPPDAAGGWGPGFDFRMPWDVDFSKETVIAVFAGKQDSTGYGVRIVRVTKADDGGLLVAWALHEPNDSMIVVKVPTQPFDLVAIPATGVTIRFVQVDPADDMPPIYFPMDGGGHMDGPGGMMGGR